MNIRISRTVFLGVALAIATLASPGCASLPRIPQLPAEVETAADRDIVAVTGNLQQLLTMTSRAALTVSRIEDEAAKGDVIPDSVDAQFDRLATQFYTALKAASDRLVQGGLKSWPELRALVAPVLERGQQLIDFANSIGAIKSKVQGFLGYLRDNLSAIAGELVFGGAR